MSAVYAIVCGAVAVILGTAGVKKLVDKPAFHDAVEQYPALRSSAPAIVGALPVLELVTAVLLLGGTRMRVGAVFAAALFLGFAAVTAGSPEDCGCGPFVPRHKGLRVVSNVVLLVGSAAVAVADPALGRGERILGAGTFVVVALSFLAVGTHAGRWWDGRKPHPAPAEGFVPIDTVTHR